MLKLKNICLIICLVFMFYFSLSGVKGVGEFCTEPIEVLPGGMENNCGLNLILNSSSCIPSDYKFCKEKGGVTDCSLLENEKSCNNSWMSATYFKSITGIYAFGYGYKCKWNPDGLASNTDIKCASSSVKEFKAGDCPWWGIKGTLTYKYEPCVIANARISLDPDYITKTEKERLFRPAEITPFDDIVCELELPHGKSVDIFGYKGELVTVNESDNNETLIKGDGKFEFVRKETSSSGVESDIYRWKIKGWNTGWTSDTNLMNKIIENQNIRCIVKNPFFEEEVKSSITPVSLCVHLWGPDGSSKEVSERKVVYNSEGNALTLKASKFKIVTLRTTSSELSAQLIVLQGGYDMSGGYGYLNIDPFKTYKEYFKFYVDLKAQDDSGWELNTGALDTGLKTYYSSLILNDLNNKLSLNSNCKDGRIYNLYTQKGVSSGGGYASLLNKFAVLDSRAIDLSSGISISRAVVVVHESGHALGGLSDEYFYGKISDPYLAEYFATKSKSKSAYSSLFTTKNCLASPSEWGNYGDKKWNIPGCSSWDGFYRPSVNSIMKFSIQNKMFNVVSCGYLLDAIVGKSKYPDGKNNFDICMNLDTIKPGTICLDNSDCHSASSILCGYCDTENNKCVFKGIGTNCMMWDEKLKKFVKGKCAKPDNPEGSLFVCEPI